jgi:hypothetical protein
MMWRAFRSSASVMGGGWRGLALPSGLGLLGLFSRSTGSTNPWDILLFARRDHEVAIIVIPLYLFLVAQDLRHPWEALVVVRVGRARIWWAGHVAAAGLAAVVVTGGLGVLAVLVAQGAHTWSWQWGTYGHAVAGGGNLLTTAGWRVPWRWALAALGLLALGLWAMGVLLQMCALWWRHPFLAWAGVVALTFLAVGLEGTALQRLILWLPGPQFCLPEHYSSALGYFPASWSVLYGVVLFAGMTGVGVTIAESAPWDGTHGGAG